MILTVHTHFAQGRRGRRLLRHGRNVDNCQQKPIPRLARLMALAIKFDDQLKRGEVRDYAALARMHGIDPSMVTRVMNLRLLAPDIQEAILSDSGKDTTLEFKQVLPLTHIADWGNQRSTRRRLNC